MENLGHERRRVERLDFLNYPRRFFSGVSVHYSLWHSLLKNTK